MTRNLVAGFATAALLTAGAAYPQERDQASKTVSYADLDLATQPGIRTLYLRIRMTAGKICAAAQQETGRTEIQRDSDERACFTAAVDDAVRRVGAPELTRIAGLHPMLMTASR